VEHEVSRSHVHLPLGEKPPTVERAVVPIKKKRVEKVAALLLRSIIMLSENRLLYELVVLPK
jgi:hypothetical protein